MGSCVDLGRYASSRCASLAPGATTSLTDRFSAAAHAMQPSSTLSLRDLNWKYHESIKHTIAGQRNTQATTASGLRTRIQKSQFQSQAGLGLGDYMGRCAQPHKLSSLSFKQSFPSLAGMSTESAEDISAPDVSNFLFQSRDTVASGPGTAQQGLDQAPGGASGLTDGNMFGNLDMRSSPGLCMANFYPPHPATL